MWDWHQIYALSNINKSGSFWTLFFSRLTPKCDSITIWKPMMNIVIHLPFGLQLKHHVESFHSSFWELKWAWCSRITFSHNHSRFIVNKYALWMQRKINCSVEQRTEAPSVKGRFSQDERKRRGRVYVQIRFILLQKKKWKWQDWSFFCSCPIIRHREGDKNGRRVMQCCLSPTARTLHYVFNKSEGGLLSEHFWLPEQLHSPGDLSNP